MGKCRDCGKTGANCIFVEEDGDETCIHMDCAGSHFICPDCGRVFPDSSYDYNGFCKSCDRAHYED